jgi:hypothetical protein
MTKRRKRSEMRGDESERTSEMSRGKKLNRREKYGIVPSTMTRMHENEE